MKKLLAILLLLSGAAFGQLGNLTLKHFPGAPTGSCGRNQVAVNDTNGNFYSCDTATGAWVAVTGAGGPPTGSAGGGLAGTYPNPTISSQSSLTFYASNYAGATIDVKVNACLADAIAVHGTCDARAITGTNTTAAQITVGDTGGDPVTLLLPVKAQWLGGMTDNTSCTLKQFGGSTIIGNPAQTSGQMVIGAANTSSLGYVYCTDPGTASVGYFYAEGFAVINHNGGPFSGHVTANNVGSYLQGPIFDVSEWNHMLFFDDTDTYDVKVYRACCGTAIRNSEINGNYGSTPLYLFGDGSGGLSSFDIVESSIVHPASAKPVIQFQDTGSHTSVVNLRNIYTEASNSDTTTAVYQNDGYGAINMEGVEVKAEVASSAATTFTSTNAFNTMVNIRDLALTNGSGSWNHPATAVVNSATSQTIKTDNSNHLSSYSSSVGAPVAPSTAWVGNPANSANIAGMFASTVNNAQVSSWNIPFTKTSTRVCYLVGTTADNTAATYDIGIYLGANGGTGTLLADTGPIAGTTFAPGATAYHCINWTQGTVVIPGGLIHIALTTSQTVTPATLTGAAFGGYIATPTAEAITTGGTLPGTITLPAVANSGAGSAGNNAPWLSIQ